jgi:hypothetical protein
LLGVTRVMNPANNSAKPRSTACTPMMIKTVFTGGSDRPNEKEISQGKASW